MLLLLVACRTDAARPEAPPREARGPDSAPPAAARPAAPPAAVERARGGLPLVAWRNHVRIYSELALDFERLANVAQWTRDRSMRWLCEEPFETQPIQIFLCDREEELRRLEAELPLVGARALERTAKGGYFHAHAAILLLVEPERNVEWLVSHEMFHSVFRHLAAANPPALNEGLAEVVPSWILYADGPSPERAAATYPGYEAVLADLVARGAVPPLERLLSLTADEFHRDRWASFALSWSLARVLIESSDPAIAGRVPLLVRSLVGDPWEAFQRVYDAELVERRWHAALGLDPEGKGGRAAPTPGD
jgi:hypothetical protein